MSKIIKALVVLVVVLGGVGLIAAGYYFAPVINANQRGVVMTGDPEQGANLTILGPGKHYWFISGYNPITNTLTRVEISEKELSLSDLSGENAGMLLKTKDGDTIRAEFVAWYRVVPAQSGLLLASLSDSNVKKIVTEIARTTILTKAAYYEAGSFFDGKVQTEFVDSVKKAVNQDLAIRGLELSVFKCNKLHFSAELLKKVEDIKTAEASIEVNRVRVEAAAVAAQETEEAAKGRKLAALQEAQARRESVIMASEAQIIAAKNWVTAETIKAEVMLVRSKAKAEAMQIEAAAKVFAGPEGERFLRYRIADSVAEAWSQQHNDVAGGMRLDSIAAGITSLSKPQSEVSKK